MGEPLCVRSPAHGASDTLVTGLRARNHTMGGRGGDAAQASQPQQRGSGLWNGSGCAGL
jgi:hypothetical protein